jgi:DNA-binding NtrC family response regulator
VTGIDPEALATLQHYQFPGNIRELENLIERAVIMADGELIRLQDLDIGAIAPTRFEPRGTLDEVQKQVIHNALLRWEGNRTKTAEELGITRQTLRKKIKDYGLLDL